MIRETAKIKEGEERIKHHFSKAAQQYVCKLVVVMMGKISELDNVTVIMDKDLGEMDIVC